MTVRIVEAELINFGLQDALDRLGIGVIAIDAQQRILFVNDKARRFEGDGFTVQNETLRLNTADPSAALDILTGAISGRLAESAAPRPIVVQRLGQPHPLAVYALPIVADSPWSDALSRAQALLLFLDMGEAAPADPAAVRDLLGLTLGEARVASLIAIGESPRDVGKRLGIAEDTARTILKRVYEKTGLTRQNKLASVLNRLLIK